MSENEYQPQQDRPSRTSAEPTRRTTPTRRSYATNRRSTSNYSRGKGEYERRAASSQDASDWRAARRTSVNRADSEGKSSAESMAGDMLGSLKGAVSSGREAISNSSGESFVQSVMDKLPDNVWVRRGILLVAALIVILILANLVTCAAGALSGGSSSSSSAASSSAASSAMASSEASGASAQVKGVASPWTEDGTFTTGDSTLDAYIKDVCDKHSTEGNTYEQNAYDTYLYVSRTDYVERENNQSPWGPTWDIEYAKQYFEENDSGNCYNYAAVVEYVLKYFGYSDAEAEPCVVGLESGAWGDHGLVFVTNKADNNKRCLVDCALSANGWMLDADSYQYDIRNINQNSSIKGNVDVLDDDNNPTRIAPGELTESSSASAESADTDDENADNDNDDESYDDGGYYDEGDDGESYYDDSNEDEGYYGEGDDGEGYYDDGNEDEGYYEEEA